MNKYIKLITIISILLFIGIIAITLVNSNNQKYTLEEIDAFINKRVPNNVYYKKEMFDSKNNLSLTTEIYVKDEKTYVGIKDTEFATYEEYLCDYKNNTEIRVDHRNTMVELSFISNGYYIRNPLFHELQSYGIFFYKKYKYLGTEVLDGKEYIKILLYDRYDRMYMYINSEDRRISKIEFYSRYDESGKKHFKFIFGGKVKFTYSYDTVTDEEIPDIEANDYPDYTSIDYINIEENNR